MFLSIGKAKNKAASVTNQKELLNWKDKDMLYNLKTESKISGMRKTSKKTSVNIKITAEPVNLIFKESKVMQLSVLFF